MNLEEVEVLKIKTFNPYPKTSYVANLQHSKVKFLAEGWRSNSKFFPTSSAYP